MVWKATDRTWLFETIGSPNIRPRLDLQVRRALLGNQRRGHERRAAPASRAEEEEEEEEEEE